MDSVTNNSARGIPSSGDEQSTLATLFKSATGKSASPAFKPDEKLIVPPVILPPPPPPAPAGSALDEAEQLSAHWDDWGMHEGVSFNDPPSSLPQDAQDTIKYFGDNSVLYQAMIKDNGGTGNTLTKADVDQFIKDAKGDAKLADETLPSGTSDSTLEALGAIVANWHAWGLHSGDTPFSNPPPDNLPPDAKAALGAITSDPYLLSQIGNHTGSGPITQQNVADFLKQASDNPVLLDQPAQDTHVQDWLDSLGDAVSPDDKKALAQTGNDAQTLLNFFNAYPRGASELNSEVPPAVADAEKRLLSVDSIKKQLVTSDGSVTRDTVGAFLKSLDGAADSAKDSWGTFTKNNPGVTGDALTEAAQTSILQANLPVLDKAGGASAADGQLDVEDLRDAGASDNSGLPDALKKAASFYADPKEFSELQSGSDGNTVDNDNFDTQLSERATDSHVHDYLDSLGDAVSDDDKKQLAQAGDDATTLLNFFNAHDRGDPALNNPPDFVRQAEDRLLSNDAVKKQITVQDGDQKGLVTRDSLGNFLKGLDGAADSAKDSWNSFKDSDKNADPTVLHTALDASLLQANTPILDAASDGAKADGEVDSQDLRAVASSQGDSGLPDALKHAAALYQGPGMFANIDTAGNDVATTQPDGLMDGNNLGNFISKEAPKMTPSTVVSMLSEAADRNMTADVDVSKLGPDVFANPQNYSGAQKAAVLQQLEDLHAKISTGNQEQDWDTANLTAAYDVNVNPNVDKVLGDIQGKIDKLSQDTDVQKFLSDGTTNSLQSIANADPGMKSALQNYFDGAIKNGGALTDALNAKDTDGKPVSVEDGLQTFIGQASTVAQALGTDGKPASLDLQQAAQKSGQQDKLKQAYENDILSGNELKNLIGDGSSGDISSAVQTFTRDAANFGSVLPTDYVSQNAGKLQQTLSDTLTDSLLGNPSNGDLDAAFADANGNLDTAKLTDALQQAEKQDPDEFKDSNGNLLPPDKIVSAFRNVWDAVRQGGGKLPDALAKIAEQNWKDGGSQGPKPGKPTGPVAEAYSKGMLHAVSALFAGGILAAKGVEGGSNPGTVSASLIAGSFQVMGGAMEAGSKYAKTTTQTALSSDELKLIENAGKAIGGTAGVISGALSIFSGVQALNEGDKPAAGVDIASGITGAWAGVAGLLEGGLGVAEAFGSEAAAAALPALAATSATLGLGAAVIGGLGALGLLIYEAVEGEKNVNAFNSQIAPGLKQWGITGGPIEPGDVPPDPHVATE